MTFEMPLNVFHMFILACDETENNIMGAKVRVNRVSEPKYKQGLGLPSQIGEGASLCWIGPYGQVLQHHNMSP